MRLTKSNIENPSRKRHSSLAIWRAMLIIVIMFGVIAVGCTDSGQITNHQGKTREPQPTDSLYTWDAAMNIYAYQPVRALQILDSAVFVGNLSAWHAQICKARIYSSTLMTEQLDSMLGGLEGIRLDSARAIGERLLRHDTILADLEKQQEVLEILASTARMHGDTVVWLQRLRQYVDVCRHLGAGSETRALRAQAEIGAALCALGQEKEGVARLDSVIYELNATFDREYYRGKFDELDALIIALKRKIVYLGYRDKYAETLPLARLIIERLDDYDKHPDNYHDGSSREPKSEEDRADYIHFYRSQAQNFIAAAYASLGEHPNMLSAYQTIENSVREVTAREHIARYNYLEQQIEMERQQAKANQSAIISFAIGILAFLLLVIAFILVCKNRVISRKNRMLAQQISESLKYKELYYEERQGKMAPLDNSDELNSLTDQLLFQHINDVILHEKLYLDSGFGRQTIMDRFQLSKERVVDLFAKGSEYGKLSNYILHLRLEHAARLLADQPDLSIDDVSSTCGFGSKAYFSTRFRQLYGMTPADFRVRAITGNPIEDTDEIAD